jgi:hypothetical protein
VQEQYKKQWLNLADFSRRPQQTELDDFFFYDEEGVMEWAKAYYNSNYHTGHLPRPGVGMRAQHWTVRHDWYTWLAGMGWAQGEIEARRELENAANQMMLGSEF